MTLAAATSPTLPLEQFEDVQPFCTQTADLMLYTEAGIAFLDGEPFRICEVEDIYLALISACTAVHTHTPQKRSWDTPLGVIEVEPRSFNIQINGIEHTPETVDRYSQDLHQAVTAAHVTH